MTLARFTAAAASLAFAVAGGVLAQTPAVPRGMTLEQYKAAAAGRLLDRDADGDGRISAAEFAAGGRSQKGADVRKGMGDRMFSRLDANGDGYLDKAEIDAMLTARFNRLDADHDGILTADERKAARGAKRGDTSPEQ